jgi:hypothetical protein
MKKENNFNLPSLSEIVIQSLEFFEKEKLSLNIPKFKKPLILGSGNAKVTSKIIFNNQNVIFADESDFQEKFKLHKDIDGAIIFSASGEKHSVIMADFLKKNNVETYLVTCNKNSSASKIIGKKKTIVSPKIKEPYTYNTSTYLGWILSFTKENPSKILNTIKKIDKKIKDFDFSLYKGFLLAIPNEFELIGNMFNVKFTELFGRHIARDVYTFEGLKHAVTVVPMKEELAIKFIKKDSSDTNFYFNGDILEINLNKTINIGEMMAIGYYIIGKIQEQNIQYFKKYINEYVKYLNKTKFGKNIKVMS